MKHIDIEDSLRQLIEQGETIEAIKLYRDFSKKSLKEAKDFVDKMGKPTNMNTTTRSLSPAETQKFTASIDAEINEIQTIIKEKRIIAKDNTPIPVTLKNGENVIYTRKYENGGYAHSIERIGRVKKNVPNQEVIVSNSGR